MENALVIQLWYYREHQYFRGVSILAATMLAYKEQHVWVGVLGIISQLKVSFCGGGGRCLFVCCKGRGRTRPPLYLSLLNQQPLEKTKTLQNELAKRQLGVLEKDTARAAELGDQVGINAGAIIDAMRSAPLMRSLLGVCFVCLFAVRVSLRVARAAQRSTAQQQHSALVRVADELAQLLALLVHVAARGRLDLVRGVASRQLKGRGRAAAARARARRAEPARSPHHTRHTHTNAASSPQQHAPLGSRPHSSSQTGFRPGARPGSAPRPCCSGAAAWLLRWSVVIGSRCFQSSMAAAAQTMWQLKEQCRESNTICFR